MERRNLIRLIQLTAWIALLLGQIASARAATLQAANNRVDSSKCGTKTAPCRSISQTIDNAADGDNVVVGPVRYGDLDKAEFGVPVVTSPFATRPFGIKARVRP